MTAPGPDPWGAHMPPAVAADALPALPAWLTPTSLLAADPVRRPRPQDLPEVAALAAHGFEPLDDAPLFYPAPALWPAQHRCWLPDRVPRLLTRHYSDGRIVVDLWDEDTAASLVQDAADSARRCRLPAPPPGRLWLLRSPWPDLGLDVVLALICQYAERSGHEITDEGFAAVAPLVLAWPAQQAWAELAPEPDHPARLWRAAGRTGREAAPLILAGLTPDQLAVLARPLPEGAGLAEPDALAWVHAVGDDAGGVEAVLAWRRLGLPDTPPSVTLFGWEPPDVAPWLAAGFTLEQAAALFPFGLDCALGWRAAGFDPQASAALLAADPELVPDEALAFDRAGIGAAERVRWVEAGFDADRCRAWRAAGVLANEARVWRAAGLGPADATARPAAADDAPVLPPGVVAGWFAWGDGGRAARGYGVVDPPGTRGRLAQP